MVFKKVCLQKIDNNFYFRFFTLISVYSIVLEVAQLNNDFFLIGMVVVTETSTIDSFDRQSHFLKILIIVNQVYEAVSGTVRSSVVWAGCACFKIAQRCNSAAAFHTSHKREMSAGGRLKLLRPPICEPHSPATLLKLIRSVVKSAK